MIKKIISLKYNMEFLKYFTNTSWLFLEKALRITVSLFIGVWIARYLGPDQFGLFSYAGSFVGLFTVIATLGLDSIVVREFLKHRIKEDDLIGTTFWLKFIGSILVLLMLTVAINFTSNDKYTNILVFILASGTILQSFNVIDFYFQSKVLSKYVVFSNIVTLIISSFIKIILILNEAPLIAFAWVVLLDTIILSVGLVYFYIKQNSKLFKFNFNIKVAKLLLKDSWPLIFSGMIITLYMKIDQVMIKEMLDTEAVGYYAAAVKITEAWYFIPMIILSSIFPKLLELKEQNYEKYLKKMKNIYALFTWLSLFISIFIVLLSEFIIEFLFGKSFIFASQILDVYILVSIFIIPSVLIGKMLLIENKQKYGLYSVIIGSILNIILNYIFIKNYGVLGAAYATVTARLVSFFIIGIFIKEMRFSLELLYYSLALPYYLVTKRIKLAK